MIMYIGISASPLLSAYKLDSFRLLYFDLVCRQLPSQYLFLFWLSLTNLRRAGLSMTWLWVFWGQSRYRLNLWPKELPMHTLGITEMRIVRDNKRWLLEMNNQLVSGTGCKTNNSVRYWCISYLWVLIASQVYRPSIACGFGDMKTFVLFWNGWNYSFNALHLSPMPQPISQTNPCHLIQDSGF